MKKNIILSFVFLFSIHAYSSECRLAHPLPLPSVLSKDGVTFKNVVLDQSPEFQNPSAYNSSKDSLDLNIFPVYSDDSKTDFIGASISLHFDNNEFVGNSNVYMSVASDLSGKTDVAGDTTVHTFQYHEYFMPVGGPDDPWYGCTICQSGDAYERTILEVQNQSLVSVQITYPVQVIWKQDQTGTYLAYTGQKTLCVQSAD